MFREGIRALVVDDEPALRRVLQYRLEWLGLAVATSASGDEAKALIESGEQFDVVLSDIMMPGELNGYGLAQFIEETRPELPVILCTAYAEELTHPNAAAMVVSVLRKPFTSAQLAAALKLALDARA